LSDELSSFAQAELKSAEPRQSRPSHALTDLSRFLIDIAMNALSEVTGSNEEWLQNSFTIRIRNGWKKGREFSGKGLSSLGRLDFVPVMSLA
jgi:hypothetical protein